jgi:hypothetical protein
MGAIGMRDNRQLADEGPLEAGDFGAWVDATLAAIRGDGSADVPCGGCTACCTASQFVHIGPDETDALAHIPAELLFPAPLLPAGHVLLGHDERGHCPMLHEGRCSIYAHRPRTCRTYDCRVFAAADAGIDGGVDGLIAARARRWRFAYPTAADRTRHESVRTAAVFIRDHPAALPDAAAPANATQHAVLAVELHERFLPSDR